MVLMYDLTSIFLILIGRVAIVGGCKEYTGAPYYAGISSLKTGSDLCHIICTPEASVPIKSLSPELIVHPLLGTNNNTDNWNEIESLLSRMDAIVIGPGLGRDPVVFKWLEKILACVISNSKPTVLDGDALYYLSTLPCLQKALGAENNPYIVLTPNAMEYARLCHSLRLTTAIDVSLSSEIAPEKVLKEIGGRNICIVQKGKNDLIYQGGKSTTIDEYGSPRRCGGQGDVLAGCIGTFLAWGNRSGAKGADVVLAAAAGGSIVTRKSASSAFKSHGRSMTTPDVIQEIGKSFQTLFDE